MKTQCRLCKEILIELNLYRLLTKAKGEVICFKCYELFNNLSQYKNKCPYCQKIQTEPEICKDCKKWQSIYQADILKNHALYSYDKQIKKVIKQYKRYGDASIVEVIQKLIAPYSKNYCYDYYVCVPPSQKHLEMRGFDHIKLVYGNLFQLSDILKPYNYTSEVAQAEKNRKQRLNTKQPFYCEPFEFKAEQKVLLLDDIYTTGRTLYHARDAIRKIGFTGKIDSLTVAR